jgi:hypothetical protein
MGNKWCGQRKGETMNGALSEPMGTQWPRRAVFRGVKTKKEHGKKRAEGEEMNKVSYVPS